MFSKKKEKKQPLGKNEALCVQCGVKFKVGNGLAKLCQKCHNG